jgi:hypothetical protein
MYFGKVWALWLIILVILCSPAPLWTQTSEQDAEKAKAKLERDKRIAETVEQAVAEVAALRLPGNRAVIFALAGDIYWRLDPERSRILFRKTISEIQAHYLEAAAAKNQLPASGVAATYSNPIDIRAEILPVISRRDPVLALEMLIQTRPQEVAEAMARYPDDAVPTTPGSGPDPGRNMAARERLLEEGVQQLVARSDPERSIKFIRDSLAKGLNRNVLPVLDSLRQKDPKAALELGEEVIRKALNADLRNEADFRTAVSFLQFAARPLPANPGVRTFNFSDEQAKELANKVVSTYLQNPSPSASINELVRQLTTPIFEKFAPERAVQLKLRVSQNIARTQTSSGRGQSRLWNSNSTPEELVSIIPRIKDTSERTAASSLFANKIGQVTDEDRARKLIEQIPDANLRARATEQFEANKANRAAQSGKLDEARGMIEGLSNRRMKVQRLVGLAMQYYSRRTPETMEQARAAMNDARSLVREQPEDGDDLQDLMQLVGGYAIIEPDVAFRIFEQTIPQFNEIIGASAVLDKFTRRSRSFEKGEIVMRINQLPGEELLLFRYINQIQMLARADLERSLSLADRFDRNDTRAIVRLLVLRQVS